MRRASSRPFKRIPDPVYDTPARPPLEGNALSPAERTALVVKCLAGAESVATKIAKQFPGNDREELAAECRRALVKASVFFKPELGWAFTTYAWTCMWNDTARLARKTYRNGFALSPKGDKTPAGFPVQFELDAPGPGGLPWGETLTAKPSDRAEPDAYDRLTDALRFLPEKWRQMIGLRYVQDWTLKEIGDEFGVTRERVRQICRDGLERLRKLMRADNKEMA